MPKLNQIIAIEKGVIEERLLAIEAYEVGKNLKDREMNSLQAAPR